MYINNNKICLNNIKELILNNPAKKIKLITKIYILLFSIYILVYCVINEPVIIGEWDDYALPIVSIIKQHNFSIDSDDIENAKEMYPEWKDIIDTYKLSPYKTRNGGEMSHYFPLYSIACVPIAVLLLICNFSMTYCLQLTNAISLIILLIVTITCLKVDDKKKLIIILALSINPILFYIKWPSAEVFIASLIGIAIVFWYNKWYKRAAVCISFAGMLNPTILFIGIIMIIDYFINLLRTKKKGETFVCFLKQNIIKIISYGSCYFVALIPFIYNYYNIGHINIITSIDGLVNNISDTFKYFFTYMFDLNFGILPYFFVIFLLSIILIPIAIYRKEWDYIKLMIAFFITILMYSIMNHINCGMTGIARYNVWIAPIMIIAVCVYFDKIVKKQEIKEIIAVLLILGIYITGAINNQYSKINADYYIGFMPIAEIVLDKVPQLYNPLTSTFESRVMHVDGGYIYETPIVYINKEGYVKKILASGKDKNEILKNYVVISGKEDWLEKQVQNLGDKESYISVPSQYIIVKKE